MTNVTGLELLTVIVKFGLGSKIISCAKNNGITGGTILLGKGTVRNPILDFLELNEIRREIVLMVGKRDVIYNALSSLNAKYKFNKPNHGIIFTTSISKIIGTHCIDCNNTEESRGENNTMYNVINVVVNRGKAELVVDSAKKAGSRGATIINGRGSGIHECNTLFGMEIEPEKEIILIISQKELTDPIVDSIRTDLKIDEPGNGIIFIQELNKTYGLY